MNDHLQAIATILALVNPAMCAAFFLQGVGGQTTRNKSVSAVKAVTAITVILLIAAVAGVSILGVFGVSLSAFACAGGGILMWIGAGMLRPGAESSTGETEEAGLLPLILFAASPGTITGVITVGAAHRAEPVPLTAIVAVLVTAAILLAVLLLVSRAKPKEGAPGPLRQIVTSYMGVIVIAMGVQFALSGFKEFMG